MALKGDDVNKYFRGGKMMPPLIDKVQIVNVDFGLKTLHELDEIANDLTISRHAVIKLFIQHELDQYYLAKTARRESAS